MHFPMIRIVSLAAVSIAFLAFGQSAQSAVVAKWTFDGHFNDFSGNGNHLTTALGSPAFGSRLVNYGSQSVSFDGASQLENTSPVGLDLTSYTVAGWVKAPLPGNTNYRGVFWTGTDDGDADFGDEDTDIEMYIQKGSENLVVAHNRSDSGGGHDFVGFADPPDDQIFHLAVTYDYTTRLITAYYDGVSQSILQGNATLDRPTDYVAQRVTLGKLGHSGLFDPNFFTGLLDEVYVFDRALTQAEVRNLMAIPEPSTLLIWSLLAGLGIGCGWRRRRAR